MPFDALSPVVTDQIWSYWDDDRRLRVASAASRGWQTSTLAARQRAFSSRMTARWQRLVCMRFGRIADLVTRELRGHALQEDGSVWSAAQLD